MNQLVEVACADCLGSLGWVTSCFLYMEAGGRERRGALCKARSRVSVRVSSKDKWVPPVPSLNGGGITTIILVMLLLPYPTGPLHFPYSLFPTLWAWVVLFQNQIWTGVVLSNFSTPAHSLTLGHTALKKKKKSLSLCPFLLHLLCWCPCHNSKSPCSEMPNFLLTDSRGNSH